MLVERYYEPHALLFDYARATQVTSLLSALNAVAFLLAPFPAESGPLAALQAAAPKNLRQCAPEAPLRGHETLQFSAEIDADSAVTRGVGADPDRIKLVQDCSLPRYLLHEQPFEDFHIGYVSCRLVGRLFGWFSN